MIANQILCPKNSVLLHKLCLKYVKQLQPTHGLGNMWKDRLWLLPCFCGPSLSRWSTQQHLSLSRGPSLQMVKKMTKHLSARWLLCRTDMQSCFEAIMFIPSFKCIHLLCCVSPIHWRKILKGSILRKKDKF